MLFLDRDPFSSICGQLYRDGTFDVYLAEKIK